MQSAATTAALIAGASFISEDAAALAAATLAATHTLDPTIAFAAAAVGIWIGDLGLYTFGLRLRALASRWSLAQRFLVRAEARVQSLRHSGTAALVASRFLPGSRLPIYMAAGLTKVSFRRFSIVTAAVVFVWVSMVFATTNALHMSSALRFTSRDSVLMVLPAGIIIGLLIAYRTMVANRRAWNWFRKYRQWEFWPAWLFYTPVAVGCVIHAIRFRGLSLPAIANPGQRNGGLIGESKFDLLQNLLRVAPENTPSMALIAEGSASLRMMQFRSAMERLQLTFPVVLKPNVGQRGQGFARIFNFVEATNYLSQVSAPVLLQRYIAGPYEAGVFYYRFPSQEDGHVFAITEKEFPCVSGDGQRTLRELIESDPRASLLSSIYLRRLSHRAGEIIPAGEPIRLVEAGNHCQGCIFKDGGHLLTSGLERTIDEICRRIPGFYIGRFDLRYASRDDLRAGRFQIIELNGAASEATNIYDSKNSLLSAYRTLYRQWKLVYAVGAENRESGHRPPPLRQVISDWRAYRHVARCYPAAH